MVQRPLSLRNLLAIAAAFIGVVGFIWFILYRNTPEVYLTALNEQKRIALIDGTVIIMQQETRIEVPRKFNHSERTIIMALGEADFEVAHNVDLPFIVELGIARVKDIGTRFTVHKEDKMIYVAVSSGKVAFVSIATKESREINAGSELTYDVTHQRFGSINAIESSKDFEQLLVFENTPLSEVIVSIQQFYGGKILIDDSIADRKFTAKLYGMPYTTAIQVICKSLGLEYSINDSIYTLKAKAGELQ
jgi:transmembrane sensor